MGRYQDLIDASVVRLGTDGWVIGPSVEPDEWRRRVKAAAHRSGWRVATGVGPKGHPWAARTDLEDERGTPWHRLGVTIRYFFDAYAALDPDR